MESGLTLKVDLCLWSRNGAATLGYVLNRINQVIPSSVVNRKFIIDDNSTDFTPQIARCYEWEVIKNEGKGISDGANTALKNVETEFFCSFEQDLLLAPNWWRKIPKLVEEYNATVAEGIRLANKPPGVRALELYGITKNRTILNNPNRYSHAKVLEASTYGPTLDNTMYKTQVVRDMGGFPNLPNRGAGVDTVLSKKIRDKGFKWLVDYDVVSTHLRKGLRDEINHMLWCGKTFPIVNRVMFSQKITLSSLLLRMVLSPFRALEIAVKMREPNVTYTYPLMRLASFKGISDGYRQNIYFNGGQKL